MGVGAGVLGKNFFHGGGIDFLWNYTSKQSLKVACPKGRLL